MDVILSIFAFLALANCGPGNGGCSHRCTPLTKNTFQCSCPSGFVFLSNGKDCKGVFAAAVSICNFCVCNFCVC